MGSGPARGCWQHHTPCAGCSAGPPADAACELTLCMNGAAARMCNMQSSRGHSWGLSCKPRRHMPGSQALRFICLVQTSFVETDSPSCVQPAWRPLELPGSSLPRGAPARADFCRADSARACSSTSPGQQAREAGPGCGGPRHHCCSPPRRLQLSSQPSWAAGSCPLTPPVLRWPA